MTKELSTLDKILLTSAVANITLGMGMINYVEQTKSYGSPIANYAVTPLAIGIVSGLGFMLGRAMNVIVSGGRE